MMITVKAFKQPVAHWEEYLQEHQGSLFLSQQWLEAFRQDAGQPIYFLFYSQGHKVEAMIGGLERPVGKGQQKQLFFFSGIASSGNDSYLLEECKVQLLKYARENKYWRVIMKSYDCQRCRKAEVREYVPFRRQEFVIDLTIDPGEITRAIHPDTRRKIRKAARQDMIFHQGHSEELLEDLFYLLNSTRKTRTDKGYGKYTYYSMPFLDQELAGQLLRQKLAVIHYVEKGGRKLSMAYTVVLAQKAYGIWMGTLPEGYKAGSPSLLIHETIKDLKARGIRYLNMGGAPLGKKNLGVSRFKLNMGARAVESSEQTTDFLIPPLSYLNYVMKLKRTVDNLVIPWKVKKILLKGMGLILRDRDKY